MVEQSSPVSAVAERLSQMADNIGGHHAPELRKLSAALRASQPATPTEGEVARVRIWDEEKGAYFLQDATPSPMAQQDKGDKFEVNPFANEPPASIQETIVAILDRMDYSNQTPQRLAEAIAEAFNATT